MMNNITRLTVALLVQPYFSMRIYCHPSTSLNLNHTDVSAPDKVHNNKKTLTDYFLDTWVWISEKKLKTKAFKGQKLLRLMTSNAALMFSCRLYSEGNNWHIFLVYYNKYSNCYSFKSLLTMIIVIIKIKSSRCFWQTTWALLYAVLTFPPLAYAANVFLTENGGILNSLYGPQPIWPLADWELPLPPHAVFDDALVELKAVLGFGVQMCI